MSKRSGQMGSTAKYHRLKKVDDGFVDLQFQQLPSKIPWKAIWLALFLFLAGSVLITVGALMMANYISAQPQSEWVLLILGFLIFIPGFYHIRLAYYAYRQYPGYSFDDIPDFD